MNRHILSRITLGAILICGQAQHLFGHGFLGNTLIKTPSGYREIQQLKENDSVISYDFAGHCVEGRVNRIFQTTSTDVLHLIVNDNATLSVSPRHLFYDVKSNVWVPAHELAARKAVLLQRCNNETFVTYTNYVPADSSKKEIFRLYDLEVDKYHNYCISTEDILVHNFAAEFVFALGGEEVLELAGWLLGIGSVVVTSKMVNRDSRPSYQATQDYPSDAQFFDWNTGNSNNNGNENNNNNNGQNPKKPNGENGGGGKKPEKPESGFLEGAAKEAARAEAARRAREKVDELRSAETVNSANSNLKKQTPEQLDKSFRSELNNYNEHLEKKADYQENPYAHDNQGLLKNNPDHTDEIISGRLNNLDKQIGGQAKRAEQIATEMRDREQTDVNIELLREKVRGRAKIDPEEILKWKK